MSLCSPVYPQPETILFLTRSLDRGGAERQLVVLAKGLADRGYPVAVAVFFGGGAYEPELAEARVRVIDLGKQGRWDILPFLLRLLRLLRKEHPVVLHAYLSVPNILAVVLKPLLSGTRIVWGVRASNVDLSRYDWLSRLAYVLERRLARFVDCIIANAHAGKRYAVEKGFPEEKIAVIPNGIDTEYFRFDAVGRQRVRREWGINESQILIGLVGRLDPMKDHPIFLEAVSRIAREREDVRFVCVGGGPVDYAKALKQHAADLGLTNRLIWIDSRDDMPAVLSALDIAASSSFGEGFSNVIAEAMACERPCVVTDVGDSAHIVGELGEVVPPRDPDALAAAMARMLDRIEGNADTGRRARARIVEVFSVDRMVMRTEQVLRGQL